MIRAISAGVGTVVTNGIDAASLAFYAGETAKAMEDTEKYAAYEKIEFQQGIEICNDDVDNDGDQLIGLS